MLFLHPNGPLAGMPICPFCGEACELRWHRGPAFPGERLSCQCMGVYRHPAAPMILAGAHYRFECPNLAPTIAAGETGAHAVGIVTAAHSPATMDVLTPGYPVEPSN